MGYPWLQDHSPGMSAPPYKEMQRTKHGSRGASPLISVLAGPRLALTRHTAGLASDPLLLNSVSRKRVHSS